MVMEINTLLQGLVSKRLSDIEKQVKMIVPVDTGSLKSSISLEVKGGEIIFKANNYGKFQDEGTMRNKKETDISKQVWPRYKAKGTGRNGNGIKPKHFTDPLGQIMDMLKSEVVNFVSDEMVKEITIEVKKEEKE